MTSWLGPFGPGFFGTLDENSRRYFRFVSARWRLKSVEGFRTIANQPARMREEHTHAGDHAIGGAEVGTTFPGPIEDQQLLLDEHGFGRDSTHAAGTGESGDRRQQMEKQDGQGRARHNPSIVKSKKCSRI